MRGVLSSVGHALGLCDGDDCSHLIRGMACHRVLRAQYSRMRELKRCDPISTRVAHPGVVLGLCVALIVSFEVMALDAEDAPSLGAQMQACLRDASAALHAWRLPDVGDEGMIGAWRAELRAMERIRFGLARGQQVALAAGASPVAAVRIQLDCCRRALVVPGQELSENEHGHLLDGIKSGEFVDADYESFGYTPGVASLSTLSALSFPIGEHAPEGSSCDSASHSGGTHSSTWSVASEETPPVPLFWPSLEQMGVVLQRHALSTEARAAVAPPGTVLATVVPKVSTVAT
jgi:hypothetical protein